MPQILEADAARSAKGYFTTTSFEKFFTDIRPLLERQLAGAITATASAIVGAWTQAGKPELKLAVPRPVQKVKKP